ncbi:unnamed protein product, partial [Ectocarpus sp. 12 AP-2014]
AHSQAFPLNLPAVLQLETDQTHPSLSTEIKHNKEMPSTATLNYFGLPGRGEATRVALAYAGKDFEDNIMGFPEYGACKWAGKGLPVLEMDDAEYTQ